MAIGKRAVEYNAHWKSEVWTWGQYCDHPITETSDKYKCKSYCAGTIDPDQSCRCSPQGLHRNNDTIGARRILTLDADYLKMAGDPDGDMLRQRIIDSGHEAMIHGTYSDKGGEARRRVAILLDEEVPPEQHGHIARVLMYELGGREGKVEWYTTGKDGKPKKNERFGPFDATCAQHSRYMFFQASKDGTGYRERFRGEMLPTDLYLMAADPAPPSEVRNFKQVEAGTPASPAHVQRAHSLLEEYASAVAGSGEGIRNDNLSKFTRRLFRMVLGGCLPDELVAKTMTEAGQACGLPDEEVEAMIDKKRMHARDAGPIQPEVAADVFDPIDEPEPVGPIGGVAQCRAPTEDGARCTNVSRLGKWQGDPWYMDTCEEHKDVPVEDLFPLDAEDGDEPVGSSWKRQDVGAMLARIKAGEVEEIVPTVCQMEGGGCLFYRGRINTLFGESGSGKTWVALAATKQEVEDGKTVVFIDFEDDLTSALRRLLAIGTDAEALTERFVYISPEEKMTKKVRRALIRTLAEEQPTLVVIDSTGESLAMEGKNPNADEDVATWVRWLPKACTPCGAAVVVVDHVTKDKDGHGSPIGSQRKKAATFSMLRVETVEPFSRGRAGSARVVANKDKAGHYRNGDVVAILHATPGSDPELELRLAKVDTPTVDAGQWDDRLLAKICNHLQMAYDESADEDWPGASTTHVVGRVGGNATKARLHLDHLVKLGNVAREKRGQTNYHTLVSPYVPDDVFDSAVDGEG